APGAGDAKLQERGDGRVAEEEHLTRGRVDLRVGGEGVPELAAEGKGASGVQARHLDLVRRASLPQGEQLAVIPDPGGVGRVLERLLALGKLFEIGRVRNAGVEGLAGLLLLLPAGGTDVAVAVAGLAALDADAVQHAVAVEPVVMPQRRKLWIGTIAD